MTMRSILLGFLVICAEAFSAHTYHDQSGQSITYEEQEIDFDNFNGTAFIAPYAGLYLFTFGASGRQFHVDLKVNGEVRRSLRFAFSYCSSDGVVSNFMMVALDEGDHVLTEGFGIYNDDEGSSGHENICPLYFGRFTEFSGVCLKRLSTANVEHQAEEMVVAFSATLTTDLPYPDPAVVQFDRVDVNIGQAFDEVSAFTAPVGGHYLFTFSTVSEHALFNLTVNGEGMRSVTQSVENMEKFDDRVTAANAAILLLSPGDEVQLYGNMHVPAYPPNVTGFYTHLSGVLLYEE